MEENHKNIMVFRPTYDEFKDFSKYIQYMEDQGAHKIGLAKVIPPAEWVARKEGYKICDLEIKIPEPIEQLMIRVLGSYGAYTTLNCIKKRMSINEFEKLALSKKYSPPNLETIEDFENEYWKTLSFHEPIYGADVPGTLTDKIVKEWNINKLDTILNDCRVPLDGINTPYLYFGMWKAAFPFHTEDMDLYSINYLHFGAPKFWYAIPPSSGHDFERLAAKLYPDASKECPAFLRHKTSMVSPKLLDNNSIPYNKIHQNSGEFIITFPFSYHAGFNLGFNCAEATNFAQERWIEYGKQAKACTCSDTVNISMNEFVRRYQPERYKLWIKGKDDTPHPEAKKSDEQSSSDESQDEESSDYSDEEENDSQNDCDKFKSANETLRIIDLLNSTNYSEEVDDDDPVKNPKDSRILFNFEDSGIAMSDEENVELSDDGGDDFGPLRYDPSVPDNNDDDDDDVQIIEDEPIKKKNEQVTKLLVKNFNLSIEKMSVDDVNNYIKKRPCNQNNLVEKITIHDDDNDFIEKITIDDENDLIEKIAKNDEKELSKKVSINDDNNLSVDLAMSEFDEIDEPRDEAVPQTSPEKINDDDGSRARTIESTLMTPPQSSDENPSEDESIPSSSTIPRELGPFFLSVGSTVEPIKISTLEKSKYQVPSLYKKNNNDLIDKVKRPSCPVPNTLEFISSVEGDNSRIGEIVESDRESTTEKSNLQSCNSQNFPIKSKRPRLSSGCQQDTVNFKQFDTEKENKNATNDADIEIVSEHVKVKPLRTYKCHSGKIIQPQVHRDETPVQRIKRFISVAGIKNIPDEILFKNCKTEEDKIRTMMALLRRNGVNGKPTIVNCRAAARRRIRDTAFIETNVGRKITPPPVCIDLSDDPE